MLSGEIAPDGLPVEKLPVAYAWFVQGRADGHYRIFEDEDEAARFTEAFGPNLKLSKVALYEV